MFINLCFLGLDFLNFGYMDGFGFMGFLGRLFFYLMGLNGWGMMGFFYGMMGGGLMMGLEGCLFFLNGLGGLGFGFMGGCGFLWVMNMFFCFFFVGRGVCGFGDQLKRRWGGLGGKLGLGGSKGWLNFFVFVNEESLQVDVGEDVYLFFYLL